MTFNGESDLVGLVRSLTGRFYAHASAQQRDAALEQAGRWLASAVHRPRPLPLAPRPIDPGATFAALLEAPPANHDSCAAYFALRGLDKVESWASGPGVSLGREVSSHLALTAALLTAQEPPDPDARLSFAHFEITGARVFLHPPTNCISPLELRGRYQFLRLVTEWAVHHLLRRCGLVEMNCCWLGVARALLLVPSSCLAQLQQLADDVGRTLGQMRTPLRLLVRWAPIADAGWEHGDLRAPLAAGFADKPEGRSWSDLDIDAVPLPDERAADLALATGLADHWPVYVDAATAPRQDARPLHPLLTDWLVWAPPGGDTSTTMPADWLRCRDATPVPPPAWMRRQLAESASLAFLRADIKGYKTVMHEAGGSMLPGMQSQCTYNQSVLMNAAAAVCVRLNAAAAPEDSVLFMHAFSDDAIICGPAARVEEARHDLQAAAGHVAHGLDIGVFALPPGGTAADGARGALHALMENRRARLAATTGPPLAAVAR